MSGSLNKATLIGHVGNDPEIRQTTDGKSLASFSIATSERWRDRNSGEMQERTEWHRVVVFSEGLVKVIDQYVKKGAKIYIEGQLRTRKWQDKDGVDRYTTEIVLQGYNSTLVMLDNRGDQDRSSFSNQSNENNQNNNNPGNFDLDDDIPF